MRFLVDALLPPVLAQWLTGNGHDATHVATLGLAGAEDHEIWQQAVADQAVLLTKDEDFVGIRQLTASGPAVCWLRIGNVTNPALLIWFERVLPSVIVAIQDGETIVEVR